MSKGTISQEYKRIIFYSIEPTRITDLQSFQLLSYLLVRSSMHDVARELPLSGILPVLFSLLNRLLRGCPRVTIISELSETKRLDLLNKRQQIRQKISFISGHSQLWLI